MKKLPLFAAVIGAALSLASCASASYLDAKEEMAVAEARSESLVQKHFSPEEMKRWNVLVIESGNTKRSKEYLEKQKTSLKRLGNKSASMDVDPETIFPALNGGLEQWFKKVSYENDAETGQTYNLVILRDVKVTLGISSGKSTYTDIALYFVYFAQGEANLSAKSSYLQRGKVEAQGEGILPYPAWSCGMTDSAVDCAQKLNSALAEGLDLLTLDSLAGGQEFKGFGYSEGDPASAEAGNAAPVGADEVYVPNNLLKKKLEGLK